MKFCRFSLSLPAALFSLLLSGCAAPLLVYVAPELVNGMVTKEPVEAETTQAAPDKADPGPYGKMTCEALKSEQQSERARTQPDDAASSLKLTQIGHAASAISCDLTAPRVDPGAYGKMNCKTLKAQRQKLQAQIKPNAPADKAGKAVALKLAQVESAASAKKCTAE